mgnify:CR=1 FL=1
MAIKAHTVTYVREAKKRSDGSDGLLFVHRWGTGYQELIFPTRQAAQDFEDRENGALVTLKRVRK